MTRERRIFILIQTDLSQPAEGSSAVKSGSAQYRQERQCRHEASKIHLSCGQVKDRDLSAAINLKNYGLIKIGGYSRINAYGQGSSGLSL